MRVLPCACLLCLLSPLLTMEDKDLLPLMEQPHDQLVLKDDTLKIGEVIRKDTNGTVHFRELGRESGSIGYQPGEYRELQPQRLAPQIITQRLKAFTEHPELTNRARRIRETCEWGLAKGQKDLVVQLVMSAAASVPESYDLTEWVIKTFSVDDVSPVGLEGLVKTVIAKNPKWITGFETLLMLIIQDQTPRVDEAVEVMNQILAVNPHNYRANQFKAILAEKSMDYRAAQEGHRIAMSRNEEDFASRLGYARCSLLLNDDDAAGEQAAWLLAKGQEVPAASAILGTVKLKLDQVDEAEPLLCAAVEGQVDEPLRKIALSNLALTYLRQGKRRQAADIWQNLGDEYSNVGLALAEGRPIAADQIGDAHLQKVANEHNLCLELRSREPQIEALKKQLEVISVRRHIFLKRIVDLVGSGGARREVTTLVSLEKDAEALRWGVYGHILGKRYDEAEDLLKLLPEDDGYAAVYRVYLAFVRGDKDGARSLYKKLVEPLAMGREVETPPPTAYVQDLAAIFDVISGQFRRFDFDIKDGAILGPSWQSENLGTGIRVHVQDQHLVLDGTQREASQAVSRAFCITLKDQLHEAWLFADPSKATDAVVGLEILNETRSDGFALGILGGKDLRWRLIRHGKAAGWQAFDEPMAFQPGKPLILRLLPGNRVGVPAAKGVDNVLVSEVLPFQGGRVTVAIFGTSDPGTTWRFAADRLDIR